MPADRWGERLTRRLGLWSLLAWVVGAAVVLCGALTYSELAAAFPRSGGVYVFVRESFGPLPAFLFTWAELLVIRPGAYGAIGITASAYTLRTLGYDPAAVLAHAGPLTISAEQVLGAVYIVLVGIVNYFGIHRGAVLQNLSTLLKAGALAVLILAGLLLGGATAATVPDMLAQRAHVGLSPFLLAMVAILWAYDGWADLAFVGGEVQRPQQTLPRALLIGTASVVVLYLGANLVYLHLIPMQGMKQAELVAADVARLLVGPAGVVAISAVIAVSTFGTLRLRVAPHTAAARAAVPDVGLSVRAARVSGGGAVRVGELPGLGNAEVRGRHRHHRDRCAGVPRHPPLPAPRAAIRDFSPLKPVGVQRAAPLRSFPAHRPSGRPTVLPVKHVPQTQLHPPNVRGSGEFLVGPRDQNCVGCRT